MILFLAEIPDPSSRNKLDESNRIEAHAVFLKGATGTSTAEEASFMSKSSQETMKQIAPLILNK